MNPDNKDNFGGIAAIINARLAADARVTRAIAFGWVCGGASITLCLTGLGVACAFYGYSYMVSVKPAAEETARALKAALDRSQVKAVVSGTMSLNPNSELTLASDQTVKLNEGATVRLEPNSYVRVVGLDVPRPSHQQLQLGATSSSDELPFTSYTIFKNGSYGSGQVVTGWRYDLSDTKRPRSQFCYYTEDIQKGVAAKYTIAVNGVPRKPTDKLAFNFDGAVANCSWFP